MRNVRATRWGRMLKKRNSFAWEWTIQQRMRRPRGTRKQKLNCLETEKTAVWGQTMGPDDSSESIECPHVAFSSYSVPSSVKNCSTYEAPTVQYMTANPICYHYTVQAPSLHLCWVNEALCLWSHQVVTVHCVGLTYSNKVDWHNPSGAFDYKWIWINAAIVFWAAFSSTSTQTNSPTSSKNVFVFSLCFVMFLWWRYVICLLCLALMSFSCYCLFGAFVYFSSWK